MSLQTSFRTALQPSIHELLRPALYLGACRTGRQPTGARPTPHSPVQCRRHQSTTATAAHDSNRRLLSSPILSPSQRLFLSRALRVNQAGELAAVHIYTSQIPVVVSRYPHLRRLMRHMYEQEASHLQTFDTLVAAHRVRPTALRPVWEVAAKGLGWVTAMGGREAAMACTEAVETEIGDHYNGQIRTALEILRGLEDDIQRLEAGLRDSARDEEGAKPETASTQLPTSSKVAGTEALLAETKAVADELRELISALRRIRDEELEHLDHAVAHDAKKAEPHWLLTGVIRAGCRGAIWLSERV